MSRSTRLPGVSTVASPLRRLVVIAVGFAMCGAGLIMLVLPGPGILVGFVGLLILATEYRWAERALERTRGRAADATARVNSSRTTRLVLAASAAALVTGGATAAVVLDAHRYLAIGFMVAGVGGLAVLLPSTQRLVNGVHGTAADPTDTTSPPRQLEGI